LKPAGFPQIPFRELSVCCKEMILSYKNSTNNTILRSLDAIFNMILLIIEKRLILVVWNKKNQQPKISKLQDSKRNHRKPPEKRRGKKKKKNSRTKLKD